MIKKTMLMTLGAGYICTQVSNVKKVDIKDELCITEENNNNLAIFITQGNKLDNILHLEVNNSTKETSLTELNKGLIDINEESNKGKLINQINDKFKLSINNYVKFDLGVVKDIVDSLDGLELKVAVSDLKLVEGLAKRKSPENTYKLSGNETLQFISSEDMEKTSQKYKRQKKVASKLTKKLVDMSPKKFINIIGMIIPTLETTLETKELVNLGLTCIKNGKVKVQEK